MFYFFALHDNSDHSKILLVITPCPCNIVNKELYVLLFLLCMTINPFLANVPILYLLKTPEIRFSGVFRGYKMGTLARNGLNYSKISLLITPIS